MKNNEMTLGAQVTNFGVTATVAGFHPVTGDPILQDEGGHRWVADAGKCEPAEPPTAPTAWKHESGFVVFD